MGGSSALPVKTRNPLTDLMKRHQQNRLKNIGARIRAKRKSLGLSMEALAKKVGISKMTLHRIEMGFTSPSIITLVEISAQLNQSIESLIKERDGHVVLLKKEQQGFALDPEYGIRIVAPRGLISDRITATHAELAKGTVIEPHVNNGSEWAVFIEGKAVVTVGSKEYPMEAGDAIYFDARILHSIRIKEKTRYVGLFVRNEAV